MMPIHEALIEGCQAELALACEPRALDGVALVVLPHGSPVAQVAFGSRAEVACESTLVAQEEGLAALGLSRIGTDLLGPAPTSEGSYCTW